MLISEIILENFMSYKYARIPLRSGLNVICGPNGAGKSSILLAVSVALGQTHTERSQKLSGLIRWEENTARITLVFDNRPKKNIRPIPEFDKDYFRLTRYLKKDDNYWFEANSKPINKNEVTSILKKFGLNPDNMLILMHQHMMTEFGSTTPQKKLQMVEEAVGLSEHRRNVLEAQEKLNLALSEEETVSTYFKNAEQNLSYWMEEYEKYKRKKELLLKKGLLEREMVWAKLIEREKTIEKWRGKVDNKEEELLEIKRDLEKNRYSSKELGEEFNKEQIAQTKIYQSILEFEKERISSNEIINSLTKTLDNVNRYEKMLLEDSRLFNMKVDSDSSAGSLHEKLGKFSGSQEIDLRKISEKIQALDYKLNEQMTQTQLLKKDMSRLEKEKTILEEVRSSKSVKEEVLQNETKRYEELSAIFNQINPQLESLNKLREDITSRETRISSFSNELNRLTLSLPFPIDVGETEEPYKLVQKVAQKLQSELSSREKVREKNENCKAAINYLTDSQQKVVTAIQVYENEMEKLSKQSNEIQFCLDGKYLQTLIKCERCGSTLSVDHWTRYLEDVKAQVMKAEGSINPLETELKGINEKLSEKRKELDDIYLEEKMLEKIRPIYDQTSQLIHDMGNSYKELDENINEKDEIIQNIAKIVKIEKSSLNLEDTIQKKMNEIFEEKLTLQFDIPRIEKELSSFEETPD
ncbi:MAG: AAA family ATPase [Candidatus Bathyarchaeota archaeon]